MKEFRATEVINRHKLYYVNIFSITNLSRLFNVNDEEAKLSDNLNVRIGEKYPITIKIEPSSSDYNDFTINDTSYVRVYNSAGGRVNTIGELIIDNNLKTITYIWDTTVTKNPSIMNSPQQYTIIIWADITYVTSEGIVMNTLIASDNITKNLIRSSRLD